MMGYSFLVVLLPAVLLAVLPLTAALVPPSNVVVFGGTGYVGSKVCERLIEKGFTVTGVSRRGMNPDPSSPTLEQVQWVSGDATQYDEVQHYVTEADAVVHTVGLLFDVESGLEQLNTIVSGSKSVPSSSSTYDNITRKTMFNVLEAIEAKQKNNNDKKTTRIPLAFVSAAEAGWTAVQFGAVVEQVAPGWLKKYLAAKRAVEDRITGSAAVRGVIYRPSLIWSWQKFDVLPLIPLFNLASAVGIPFVDKTVRVETLAAAIVAGIENDSIAGVQRYPEMEQLAAAYDAATTSTST